MTARALVSALAGVATWMLFALVCERHGEALGWAHAEAHAARCSELAPGAGYRWGLYDENGAWHCAMYGEEEP